MAPYSLHRPPTHTWGIRVPFGMQPNHLRGKPLSFHFWPDTLLRCWAGNEPQHVGECPANNHRVLIENIEMFALGFHHRNRMRKTMGTLKMATSPPIMASLTWMGMSILLILSGGKSTQLSYPSQSKDTLIENDSSKSESHPVKYYLRKKSKSIWF